MFYFDRTALVMSKEIYRLDMTDRVSIGNVNVMLRYVNCFTYILNLLIIKLRGTFFPID